MNVNNDFSATSAVSVSSNSEFYSATSVNGDIVMSGGIAVLYEFMTFFTEMANIQYAEMSAMADRARQSQEYVNVIDNLINGLETPEDTATLPPDLIAYMKSQNIYVDYNPTTGKGGPIDKWLNDIGHPSGSGLNKGELEMVKIALESDASRCSDFVTESQLQIQKVMQSYNVCVSLINSMQTLLAEMNKSIASNIR